MEGVSVAVSVGQTSREGVDMTNAEIIATQQAQIDDLFTLIEEFKMLINWQKLEIEMLEDKQFVRNDN